MKIVQMSLDGLYLLHLAWVGGESWGSRLDAVFVWVVGFAICCPALYCMFSLTRFVWLRVVTLARQRR